MRWRIPISSAKPPLSAPPEPSQIAAPMQRLAQHTTTRV